MPKAFKGPVAPPIDSNDLEDDMSDDFTPEQWARLKEESSKNEVNFHPTSTLFPETGR